MRRLKRALHTSMEFDRPSERSPEKDRWFLTDLSTAEVIFTLKMTSAQDVETSVPTNSPSQDSFHPDDQIPSR